MSAELVQAIYLILQASDPFGTHFTDYSYTIHSIYPPPPTKNSINHRKYFVDKSHLSYHSTFLIPVYLMC